MKTKNNVQKAVKKTLAVGISLVLISITVSAQDFWKSLIEKSSFNTIASAMIETGSDETRPVRNNFVNTNFEFKTETEKPLELENWMTNESRFNVNLTIEDEIETPLKLEEWMTDESNFENSIIDNQVEKEVPLELENWMTNDNLFETNKNQEQPLKLESWMTSEKIWLI